MTACRKPCGAGWHPARRLQPAPPRAWQPWPPLASASSARLSAQAPPPDPIFQAMRDEIDRARKLTLANLEAPYFVEYVIDEEESFAVSANLGGLLSRRKDRFRSPDVHVRVGDYKFDNGNFGAASAAARATIWSVFRWKIPTRSCAATSG